MTWLIFIKFGMDIVPMMLSLWTYFSISYSCY
jgi:hypothetical protein